MNRFFHGQRIYRKNVINKNNLPPQGGYDLRRYPLCTVYDENVLEPEIYIFKQYRNKGYGSRVLKKFVDMAFKEGLWKEKKEIMLESNPPRVAWQEEKVFPTKLISTVRVENEYSQRMMTACGFIENNDAEAIFRGYISEDDEVFDPVEVKEYYLTKEQYMKGQR